MSEVRSADQLVSIKAVVEILDRSRASIYRDIKKGTFPQPKKVGGSSKWRLSDVNRFLAEL